MLCRRSSFYAASAQRAAQDSQRVTPFLCSEVLKAIAKLAREGALRPLVSTQIDVFVQPAECTRHHVFMVHMTRVLTFMALDEGMKRSREWRTVLQEMCSIVTDLEPSQPYVWADYCTAAWCLEGANFDLLSMLETACERCVAAGFGKYIGASL